MPKMNGFQLLKAIRSNPELELIPVIMLTAKADSESMITGLELKADDYITKPFDVKILLLKVQNLLNKERLLRTGKSDINKPVSRDEIFLNTLNSIIDNQLANTSLVTSDLASQLNMSLSTFSRNLKRISGKSPNSYLKEFRLHRAKEMIQSNSGNVSEIAVKVGFSSLSYFSSQYRLFHNCTPSEHFQEF